MSIYMYIYRSQIGKDNLKDFQNIPDILNPTGDLEKKGMYVYIQTCIFIYAYDIITYVYII
jgi:hypothetical protein